jgi:hypothetical protein
MNSLYQFAKRIIKRFPHLKLYLMMLDAWIFARRLDYLVQVRRKPPILIYQMGKVGSSSVYASFPAGEYDFAVHVHYLNLEVIESNIRYKLQNNIDIQRYFFRGKAVYQRVIQRGYPCKVITLVREPIGRSLSAFFQSHEVFIGDSMQLPIRELEAKFFDRFPHEVGLNWFDYEFGQTLGVNVYDYHFDHDKGYTRIRTPQADILLMKLELDDTQKEAAIAEFLDFPSFKLATANIGSEKEYSEKYQEFKQKIVLPEVYIKKILESKFAQHFYTDAERDKLRRKWMQRLEQETD